MTRIPDVPYVQGRNSYSDSQKYGIAIHATANTAPASGEAGYATRRTDGTSSHLYVDGAEVIQSLELEARAGHAGSRTGNYNAVAVEVTGLNSWSRAKWLDSIAWNKLGRALAFVCRKYGIEVRHASVPEMKSNPTVRAFYSHDDMRLAWGGTDHTDPGPNFPWDMLLESVNAYMPGGAGGDGEDDWMSQGEGLRRVTNADESWGFNGLMKLKDKVPFIGSDGKVGEVVSELAATLKETLRRTKNADEAVGFHGILNLDPKVSVLGSDGKPFEVDNKLAQTLTAIAGTLIKLNDRLTAIEDKLGAQDSDKG